jgi:regulator of protease activity HflC (stomatin/prohibitin superfamily)
MKLKNLLFIAVIAMLFTACAEVDPGYEGFYYYQYGGGVDRTTAVKEGTHACAIWNSIEQINVRQQSISYDDVPLKDMNQVVLTVDFACGIVAIPGQTANLYMLHGEEGEYQRGFVADMLLSTVKDVFGKYTYQEILGEKRNKVEDDIALILQTKFEGNFLEYRYFEVKDVQPPTEIQTAITLKESQDERNLYAQKLKLENTYIADAQIEKARGDSASKVIRAAGEAQEIKIKQEQLRKSPDYINYIRAEKWDGTYGNNNVYGATVLPTREISGR